MEYAAVTNNLKAYDVTLTRDASEHIDRAMRFDATGLRTLLVPLDGSSFAERVLPLAINVATQADAELRIVHVHSLNEPSQLRSRHIPQHFVQQYRTALRSYKKDYIEHIVEEVRRVSAVSVTSEVLDNNNVVAALREAIRNDVDMVIMAAHGKGLVRRWVAGSTVHSLIRNAHVPVIVVGADGTFSAPRPEQVRRILIALDGSRRAEHTFETALTLADTCEAEVVLLRVIPQSTAFGAYRSGAGERHIVSWEVQMAAAHRYLLRTANRMKQRSRVADSRVVLSHRSIARTIAANASAFNADLIAVATRKDANKRWLGSVAERVVQFAPMPVLVAAA